MLMFSFVCLLFCLFCFCLPFCLFLFVCSLNVNITVHFFYWYSYSHLCRSGQELLRFRLSALVDGWDGGRFIGVGFRALVLRGLGLTVCGWL